MARGELVGRTVDVYFREPFPYGGDSIVHVSGRCAGSDGNFLVISEVAHAYIDQKIEPVESPLCGLELYCCVHDISVVIPVDDADGVPDVHS